MHNHLYNIQITQPLNHLSGYCKKKSAVIAALQQIRIETISPGDGITYQGNLPKIEDGQFTILEGECEIMNDKNNGDNSKYNNDNNVILNLIKNRKWDLLLDILNTKLDIISTLFAFSGFGQTESMYNSKWKVTVRASSRVVSPCVLVVLPKDELKGGYIIMSMIISMSILIILV